MLPLRIVIKESVWVIITALVLSVAAQVFRTGFMAPVVPTGVQEQNGPQEGGASAIGLDAAIDHFRNQTAVFADARSESAYLQGHIEGALHLDPHQFDTWSEYVVSKIDADALIIAYCDGEHCTLGLELAEKLAWLGYDQVHYLKDGWSRWIAAQMPTETGPGTLHETP